MVEPKRGLHHPYCGISDKPSLVISSRVILRFAAWTTIMRFWRWSIVTYFILNGCCRWWTSFSQGLNGPLLCRLVFIKGYNIHVLLKQNTNPFNYSKFWVFFCFFSDNKNCKRLRTVLQYKKIWCNYWNLRNPQKTIKFWEQRAW